MHSDTVGGSEYSADYAYYLQQMLRSAYSEDFISAFGAGTCGDLNHINVNKKEPVKGFDVAERLDPRVINKRLLESLVKAGAFDSLNKNRAQTFGAVEALSRHSQATHEARGSNQNSDHPTASFTAASWRFRSSSGLA